MPVAILARELGLLDSAPDGFLAQGFAHLLIEIPVRPRTFGTMGRCSLMRHPSIVIGSCVRPKVEGATLRSVKQRIRRPSRDKTSEVSLCCVVTISLWMWPTRALHRPVLMLITVDDSKSVHELALNKGISTSE